VGLIIHDDDHIISAAFVLFPLAIVLSVLLRYMDSDYPFGIFKLFRNLLLGQKTNIKKNKARTKS
jgi:hypothetical protein